MKIMKKLLALLSVVLVVASCSKDIDSQVETNYTDGAVRLGVAMQSNIASEAVTVKIYKVENGEEMLVRRYTSLNDVPSSLALLEGDYVAKVQVGEKQVVSFDKRYYAGQQEFTIERGIETDVVVDCKLQSTIVRVEYDSSIDERLNNGYFTTVAVAESYDAQAIATGDVHSLKYTETKDGYFIMPAEATTLFWHFEGTHPAEGTIMREEKIENIVAAAKYTIKLKYSKDAPGGLAIEATIDYSIEEMEDVIIFSPDPTIIGDGFDISMEQMSIDSRNYKISSLAAINTITIAVDGTTFDLLNNTYAGATLTKIDDTNYDLTLTREFFNAVSGGQKSLVFHVTDIDGGNGSKEVVYNVQGIMPLSTADYSLWFGNVTFKATVIDSAATSVKIAYSADGQTWTEVDAVRGEDGLYTATGSNFAADKNYRYKLIVNSADSGATLEHTTAAGTQIPNGDMEQWHQQGSVLYPYAADASPFWLTGNLDAPVIGAVTLTKNVEDVHSGSTGRYSAFLDSQFAGVGSMGKFAAGNLFTGTFVVSGMDGTVNFGRDFNFTAKPESLSFWMKYNEGTIDNAGTNAPANATGTDLCTVMILITDWQQPYAVNTKDSSTFFTMADLATMDGVIGYGYYQNIDENGNRFNTEQNQQWNEYTIPITYREDMKDVTPRKIVVSFTPSGFGDYFCGSTDSWMYVDDVRLNY